MSWVMFGTILALVGLVVYYVSRNQTVEMEKAALENSKTARDEKIVLLENAALAREAALREKEKNEVEAFDDDMERSTVRFYPRVRENKDDLN